MNRSRGITTTPLIQRNYSRYEWEVDLLDNLDKWILGFIKKNPGTNVINIWRHVDPESKFKDVTQQTLRYRVATLSKANYIRTGKVRNERRCYLVDEVDRGQLRG